MKVALTGAEGLVGGVLRAGLPERFALKLLTRVPQPFPSEVVDLGDAEALTAALRGADAVIHLAAAARLDAGWDEVLAGNIVGTRNVYEAAILAGVKRVVFASSGHVIGLAEEQAGPSLYALSDPRSFDEAASYAPDSLYAVSKVQGETLGRFYAEVRGLEVICVRLGTVLPADSPRSGDAGRGRSATLPIAERYPRLRAKWLSHRDCCQLFASCLDAPALSYAIVYGTSNNPRQIWSLRAARALGYQPQDSAPANFEDSASPPH